MTSLGQSSPTGQNGTPTAPDLKLVPDEFGADHFIAWALGWRDAGYPPLILGGDDGKKLLVRHITGYSPHDATEAEIRSWAGQFGHLQVNLGIRCPVGVIGVDIDAYDNKRGLETLAECEAKWGALPPTHTTTARDDGSGIRWYRVPDGWRGHDPKAPDGTDGHIELIQRHHRYAAVPPSGHANGPDYRLYAPQGDEIAPGILPPPSQLRELPAAWQGGLATIARAVAGGYLTNADIAAWLDEPTGDDYPHGFSQVITGLDNLRSEGTNRHKATFSALCWAFKEANAGGYARRHARDELKAKWLKIIRDPDDGRHDEAEFDDMVAGAIERAEADDPAQRWLRMCRKYGTDTRNNRDMKGLMSRVTVVGANGDDGNGAIFKVLGPTEWAKPVDPVAFLIPGALCDDTFGVNGGPKKSLKTHDNHAIALSVAGKINLYLSDCFPINRSARVLYIVGEGGEVPVRRTMHRMARAYGLNLDEIQKDRSFPLHVAFGAAPINSEGFRDELRSLLDRCQPELVLLESFYNFHPQDVETSNLFARGQLIDSHHRFIRNECRGATSIITDHFRSTAINKTLDLDNISMAGQAENADSWILRNHRKTANVRDGEFWMATEFGSRQWGATEWHVDWHLGPFDFNLGCHVGDISWDVNPVRSQSDKPTETKKVTMAGQSVDDIVAHIRSHVQNRPQQTMSQLQQSLLATTDMTRKQVKEMWAKAQNDGWIHTERARRDEIDPQTGDRIQKTRDVWTAGNGPATVVADRRTWGV